MQPPMVLFCPPGRTRLLSGVTASGKETCLVLGDVLARIVGFYVRPGSVARLVRLVVLVRGESLLVRTVRPVRLLVGLLDPGPRRFKTNRSRDEGRRTSVRRSGARGSVIVVVVDDVGIRRQGRCQSTVSARTARTRNVLWFVSELIVGAFGTLSPMYIQTTVPAPRRSFSRRDECFAKPETISEAKRAVTPLARRVVWYNTYRQCQDQYADPFRS